MIDISQVRWAAEFDIPKSVNTIEMQNVRYCVSKLTNVKIQRWHLICRWMTLSYTMFWMNDRNSIYLKKLNRCTRSRLTGSSSIVRIHSDFTVRDSYMTRWVEHGCAWVIHIWQSMSNRYTMHMQLIFTMYGSIWDLQKLWCISYVEYVSYANHQSDS